MPLRVRYRQFLGRSDMASDSVYRRCCYWRPTIFLELILLEIFLLRSPEALVSVFPAILRNFSADLCVHNQLIGD